MTLASEHWIIVPIVLPLLAAALLLFAERIRPAWQAPLSLAVTAALAAVAFSLVVMADSGHIGVYLLGNWQVPFGIALVVDRLSALMLALTAVIALGSLIAAWRLAGRGPHFHAFFQLQLAGLNGAFLTGDLFNLFVFFEVLLIASYALLLHNAGGRALRSGLHYVVINLVGASLFLIAASLLYGVAGTLNFADLAWKLPHLPAWDVGLARAAALLLLVVFGVKAALLPLGFWLPDTYGAASGPVAALFAIMTKVGIYAIVRLSLTVFAADQGPLAGVGQPILFALGLVTMVFASLGALAARRLTALIAYLVLMSSAR
jgi:multicomponent K+:H+ antiporter subunit D